MVLHDIHPYMDGDTITRKTACSDLTDRPRLLLLRLLSLSLSLGSLLPHTGISSLTPQLSQLLVRTLLTLGQITALDLREAMGQSGTGIDGESRSDLGDGVLGGGLDLVGGAVQFLVLAGFAGEEDQAGFVGLETGDVGG